MSKKQFLVFKLSGFLNQVCIKMEQKRVNGEKAYDFFLIQA